MNRVAQSAFRSGLLGLHGLPCGQGAESQRRQQDREYQAQKHKGQR